MAQSHPHLAWKGLVNTELSENYIWSFWLWFLGIQGTGRLFRLPVPKWFSKRLPSWGGFLGLAGQHSTFWDQWHKDAGLIIQQPSINLRLCLIALCHLHAVKLNPPWHLVPLNFGCNGISSTSLSKLVSQYSGWYFQLFTQLCFYWRPRGCNFTKAPHFYRTHVHMEPIIGSPFCPSVRPSTFLKPCEDLVKTVNVVNVDSR